MARFRFLAVMFLPAVKRCSKVFVCVRVWSQSSSVAQSQWIIKFFCFTGDKTHSLLRFTLPCYFHFFPNSTMFSRNMEFLSSQGSDGFLRCIVWYSNHCSLARSPLFGWLDWLQTGQHRRGISCIPVHVWGSRQREIDGECAETRRRSGGGQFTGLNTISSAQWFQRAGEISLEKRVQDGIDKCHSETNEIKHHKRHGGYCVQVSYKEEG